MNINFFFSFVLIGLIAIYKFFIPIKLIPQTTVKDIPIFELNDFTLYELNKEGLVTLMSGETATRYSDNYSVSDINFTDNSHQYRVNMTAGDGIYKNNIISLTNNIVFTRSDGLNFKTLSATYNKDTNIITTDGNYSLFKNDSSVLGDNLIYNNILNTIKSTNIVVTYQLGE